MALSLDSIFAPVNDFFINKLKVDEASPIYFRFNKFGSIISDDSFIESESRQEKPSAQETFSDLTNMLPFEESDGVNITFGSSLIDSRYNQLLMAAIPLVNASDPNSEAIKTSFGAIKAGASREWERYSLARGGGIGDSYRASFATPANWYDKNNKEIWTSQSFEVTKSVTPLADNDPKRQLWKLKLADDKLKTILPALGTATVVEPIAVHQDMVLMTSAFARGRTPPQVIVRDHRGRPEVRAVVRDHRGRPEVRAVVRDHRGGSGVRAVVRDHRQGPKIVGRDHRTTPEVVVRDHRTPASQNLRTSLRGLELNKRLKVLRWVRENAPTQPSSSRGLTIEFEYCVVNIRRPWLMDSFIRDESWYIPGSAKGEESAPGPEMNLSALPVSFIAIRNLSISGAWSQVDIDAAKTATDFGPFEVNTEIVNNRLSHDGIQIIGYILQRMTDLPPNNSPT